MAKMLPQRGCNSNCRKAIENTYLGIKVKQNEQRRIFGISGLTLRSA
jgi:hypothetical protein